MVSYELIYSHLFYVFVLSAYLCCDVAFSSNNLISVIQCVLFMIQRRVMQLTSNVNVIPLLSLVNVFMQAQIRGSLRCMTLSSELLCSYST